MNEITMQPIGMVRTSYPEKFGVPRQSGLVPAARGRLIFERSCRREEAVRGLEGFSHVWLVFLFHEVGEEDVRLSVRPPRLGGNEKVGVYATRSPFRPNRIGLSVCRLQGINREGPEAPSLELSGVDLVDGTPVLDVKPYLPYADRVEGAVGSYGDGPPEELSVEIAEGTLDEFEQLSEETRQLIVETLRWDARPAYHEEERTYYLRIEKLEVAWKVEGGVCRVISLKPDRAED